MKRLALILMVLFIFSGTQALAGQWIGCDLAPENSDQDPNNDVVNVVILKGGVETVAPYYVDPVKNKVRLVDLTPTDSGLYEFAFENSQGRRSEYVSFDLSAPPGGCSQVQLYSD